VEKILVTGGLGFIGSNLVDKLIETKKYNVWVIDNHMSDSSYFEYRNLKAQYIADDVANISQWRHELGYFDVIIHLGAHARIQPSFRNPVNTLNNNIIGTAAVCEYARHYAKRVVYAGSSSFYSGPKLNPYAFSKYIGEEVCDLYTQIYGLSTVTARFFNVYGPRQPKEGDYATVIGIFERQHMAGQDLTIIGDGDQRRDFTHVNDICDGLITMAQNSMTGVYNLGTGTNYSINEIARMIMSVSSKNINKIYLPQRPGEARITLADISKTTNDMGWVPKENLSTYIENVIK